MCIYIYISCITLHYITLHYTTLCYCKLSCIMLCCWALWFPTRLDQTPQKAPPSPDASVPPWRLCQNPPQEFCRPAPFQREEEHENDSAVFGTIPYSYTGCIRLGIFLEWLEEEYIYGDKIHQYGDLLKDILYTNTVIFSPDLHESMSLFARNRSVTPWARTAKGCGNGSLRVH